MTKLPFKFDEIGIWSELKLEIIEQYGAAYTKAFARTLNLTKYYIDAFSGAGKHVENEFLAERFAEAVEAVTAEIFIEEDFSLGAIGEEAKLEYELAKLSGDEERLEKLLKALWEEDGIDPERTRPREMSGIKRIVIVQYGSVHAIGFRSDPDRFCAWLKKFDLLNLPGEITRE